MASFEYIDDYLKDASTPEKASEFEQRVLKDNEFAEEVAFYMNTIRVAKRINSEDKKTRFKEIYYSSPSGRSITIRKLRPYSVLAAAILTMLFVGLYFYHAPVAPSKIADRYIDTHMQTLGVQMGVTENLLQQGKNLYNDKNYPASLIKFETLLEKQPFNADALENAGIVSLKLQDYNKSLRYFKELSGITGLNENPGKFYWALTLMKRSKSGDREIYTRLLNEVVKEGRFGEAEAAEFLKSLD